MIPAIGTLKTTPRRGETAAPQRKWLRVLQVEVANVARAAEQQRIAMTLTRWLIHTNPPRPINGTR